MEDERRKFLQGLIAAAGGAAFLPELVEASQSATTVEKPLSARLLKRETNRDEPFSDAHMQMEVTGANGARQIITSHATQYADTNGNRRVWATMQTETFENAAATKPIMSDVITSHSVIKKIDSATVEITDTTAMNGKLYTHTVRAAIPSVRPSAEGLSDEDLVEKFFLSKVRGGVK